MNPKNDAPSGPPADPVLEELRAIREAIERRQFGELLNADEAAAFLNLSRSAVYRLVAAGEFPQVRVPGTHPKFRKADLQKWLAKLKPAK